jgi:hypothetical protein
MLLPTMREQHADVNSIVPLEMSLFFGNGYRRSPPLAAHAVGNFLYARTGIAAIVSGTLKLPAPRGATVRGKSMKDTLLGPSRGRWLLMAALMVGGAAAAQDKGGGLPPPGTMSAQMPEGVEMYFSMVISDADQQVSQNIGMSAAEARIRSMKECSDTYKGCVELVTFPLRNQCMGIAVDKKPKPNVRALFVNVAENGKTKPGELAQKSLDQCKAGGGAKCESQHDYCF